METKKRKVQNHLRRYSHITQKEAYERYRSMRLAAVVFNLKEEGWEIVTRMQNEGGVCFAQYHLVSEGGGKSA